MILRLSRTEWAERRIAHRERLRVWADDRVERMKRSQKHPVYDFLFEYYAYRPAYLLRWSPGADVLLEDCTAQEADWPQWLESCENGVIYPSRLFPEHRIEYLQWAVNYLRQTGSREPFFGCFGLHEWAMVYQETNIRHGRVPLRLSREVTDAVVDEGVLRCSHYDAFRFFTPAAVPKNRFHLERETSTQHDQPACLHVNMDLYKFGFVLAPLIPAELIADAFELARQTRELDMRASPYDLAALGFPPIRIETREGREEYVHFQREIMQKAKPIRASILAAYESLLERRQCDVRNSE
jgi:hypothetical protein